MKHTDDKMKTKSIKALERNSRIETLGGFGRHKVKVIDSKKQYNRRKMNGNQDSE